MIASAEAAAKASRGLARSFTLNARAANFTQNGISAVGVYPCEGGRDEHSEAALDAALQAGGWQNVTPLPN
jgi:protein-L-isoaspartate(D-aspartate) O-methyltransferase